MPPNGGEFTIELRLILGDQLNAGHSWFRSVEQDVLYILAELPQELGYVRHHRQKVLAFLGAMHRFAGALSEAGHRVRLLTLDETADADSLPSLLNRLITETGATGVRYLAPDEYRLDRQLAEWAEAAPVPVTMQDSEHFITSRDAWADYPHSRMEFFYRALRREHKVLLTPDGKPEGGQWNFDQDNREKLPKDADWPAPLSFHHDLSELNTRLDRHGVDMFGEADPHDVPWPLTRQESRTLLAHFLSECLPSFGRYQDAMTHRGWSLYHSRLSFSLNTKMLHPMEVIRAAETHWRDNSEHITIAQVEGFIRQILGWREFVRALYWAHMPDYATHNALSADRPLPDFFWTGDTDMACLRHSIGQSLEHAYAHHIQRLMVIGNYALLTGVNPDAVDAWYLGVYVDAIEWVEMPNTRGMSQYADGGLIASKPYAASGQYINKMSDYCRDCPYDVRKKSGPGSCPFNSLYWDFLHRNGDTLRRNARMKLVYANWDRQPEDRRQAILDWAATLLES